MSRFRPNYNLSDDQKQLMENVRAHAELLEDLIEQAPNGREKSLAFTKLEECVMWAVKGITAK